MKTSNKIILIGYGFILLCFTAFFIAAKSSFVEKEMIDGSGNISTRSLGKMTVDRIQLNDQFECILDPNSSDIVVTGDDNVIAVMENPIKENKFTTLYIYGDTHNIRTSDNPVFTIGVKDLDALTIDMSDVSQLSCLDTIKASKISINGDTNVKANLILKSERVTIDANGSSNLKLSGSSTMGILTSDNNALLESRDLTVNEWVVNMKGFAIATVFASESISGNMKSSSKVHLYGKPKSDHVVKSRHSEITMH